MNEHRQDKDQNNKANASFETSDQQGELSGATTTSVTSPVQANSSQRVLIVTAVDAEKDAVLRGLGDMAAERFDVIAAGVGPASAAAGTAAILAYAVAAASTRALAQGSTAPSPSDVAQASATSDGPGAPCRSRITSLHAGDQCRHRRRVPRPGRRRLPRSSRRHGCCRSGLTDARRLP